MGTLTHPYFFSYACPFSQAITSLLVPYFFSSTMVPFLAPSHSVFLMTSCLLSHACFFFHLPYFSSALSLSHILSSPFFLALSLLCTCTFLHLCSHMIALVFCSLTFSNTRPLSWSCLSCAHAFLCVLAFLCSHALLLSTLPLLALTLSCVLMLALSHTSFLFFGEHSFWCALSLPFSPVLFSFSLMHFLCHMFTLLHAGFFSHDLSFCHALDFSPILTFLCPCTLSQNLVLDPFHTLMLAFSHMYSFSVHLSLSPCIPSLSFLCCLPLYSLCITFLECSTFLVALLFWCPPVLHTHSSLHMRAVSHATTLSHA